MYEEGNKKLSLNWVSLAIKLAILAVLVFILCWVFTRNSANKTNKVAETDTQYISNITAMKESAFEYFTESHLPKNVGETEKVTLSQMVNQHLLVDFTDDGDKCDLTNSYVQTTKMTDGDYALKVSLECGKKKDFIVTTIEKQNCINNNCPTDNNKDNNSNDTTNNTKPNTNTSTNTNNTVTKPSSSTTTKTTTSTVKTTVNVTISCTNCSDNNNNKPTEPTKPSKTTYYLHERMGDWEYGYSYAYDAENKEFTNTTYRFCKYTTKTIYTTSYITNSNKQSYSYELKFNDLKSYNLVGSVGLVRNSEKYFSNSTTDYNAYINSVKTKPVQMTGNDNSANATIKDAWGFKNSSLKSNNFTFDVSVPYQRGNDYYTKVTVNVNNTYGVNYEYDSKLRTSLYFVPLKFDISYVSANDCFRDSSSRYSYYSNKNYLIDEPKYDTYWMHRTPETIWSTSKNLSGWNYTGISEQR